ncbi:MAG: DUF1003 domain-containing protein [Candidatus Woesearchaeota archaeon]|nr:DUF1003 domain-containing protein [Candidatus Woesearchaeota archaeon]
MEQDKLAKEIDKEEVTIEDLHKDLENKLKDMGFIFDKRKFYFHDKDLSLGEKIADGVAKFGGSWLFIIIFGLFLISWITLNVIWLSNRGWDPYPFILLNLILSSVAAFQAPVIMMSQNRAARREKMQQEILVEKDIVDFNQDRLDLILDQKEYEMLKDMNERLKRIEKRLDKKR